MNNIENTLSVTLVKSLIGRIKSHIACAHGLGLRKVNKTVVVLKTRENLGMINSIKYLLKCEENHAAK